MDNLQEHPLSDTLLRGETLGLKVNWMVTESSKLCQETDPKLVRLMRFVSLGILKELVITFYLI